MVDASDSPLSWNRLWNRQLDSYPNTKPRMGLLAMTVVATVALYYELYVVGSVSTLVLEKFHMSFKFFIIMFAVANLVGAFGSLFAGVADRVGRSRLVIAGLILTGVLIAFIIPAMTSKWGLSVCLCAVGLIEGICLVATPALIRDFSPQTGRATAMGFWTAGPVLGSLVVSVVGSNTIGAKASPSFWTHEFHICGIAGLVVALLSIFFLRELSPGLRDQLMVSMHDRMLIEARAKGLDIEDALRHPFRQLLKPDVLVSSFAVSVMLLIYYIMVGVGVVYFQLVFGFSTKDANGLGNWGWGFDAIAVIGIGLLSDRVRVRKPFMVLGAVAGAVMLVVLIQQSHHANTSYYAVAGVIAALSFCLGIAYTPWMASFTETVEERNPALTATGLAIWGWIIRVIVFAAYLIVPTVINTVNPLVQYGPAAQQYATGSPRYHIAGQYAAQFKTAETLQTVDPATFASLQANPSASNPAALKAVGDLQGALHVTPIAAIGDLQALQNPGFQKAAAQVAPHATALKNAKAKIGSQFRNYFWICFGGMIFFLLAIPLLKGRWNPKAARADEEAHEAEVDAEMAKLHLTA